MLKIDKIKKIILSVQRKKKTAHGDADIAVQ